MKPAVNALCDLITADFLVMQRMAQEELHDASQLQAACRGKSVWRFWMCSPAVRARHLQAAGKTAKLGSWRKCQLLSDNIRALGLLDLD